MDRKRSGNRIELLAPAGDLKRAQTAVLYGADAVYLGGMKFSLRSRASNFTMDDIREACAFAHAHGSKVHVTVNMIPHDEDFEGLSDYLKELEEIGVDAFITASPAIMKLIRECTSRVEIHCSTQMSVTNAAAANWLKETLDIDRVVLARECSMNDVKSITRDCLIDTEAFIHGGMCVNISGRCTLSNRMTLRDANRGGCAQSCRWSYHLYDENREISEPGMMFTMGSKDMCAFGQIRGLIEAGVASFKIEGRMKTALYVATVARTYRKAIDDYLESEEKYRANLDWYRSEIAKCTYRQFTTGFYFGKPDENTQIYDNNTYVNEYIYLGIVEEIADVASAFPADTGLEAETQLVRIEQRNKFCVGDTIEIMKPSGDNVATKVEAMYNETGEPVESCPHSKQLIWLKLSEIPEKYDLLRVKNFEEVK